MKHFLFRLHVSNENIGYFICKQSFSSSLYIIPALLYSATVWLAKDATRGSAWCYPWQKNLK